MATNDELLSRIDVLEGFVMKHLSKIYARVEPGEIPTSIEGMKTIYSKTRETPKPPAAPMDPRTKAMSEIYKHHSSPKAKKEG